MAIAAVMPMWDKALHEVPKSEFSNRIERVREFCVENDLSGVVVYSQPPVHQWSQTGHVGYLTNWVSLDRNTDTMVLVPRNGEAVFLIAGVDYMLDQIEPVSWMEDIRMVASPDPRAISAAYTDDASRGGASSIKTFGQEAYEILKATGSAGRPVAISGMEAMSAALYRDIEASSPEGIADTIDVVAELRSVKTPGEVSLLRKSAAISDRAYETMMEVLEEGMLAYELMAELDRSARADGGDLVYHCIHWAPNGELDRGHLSLKPLDQPLRAGDYINVNAYVVYKGYWIQSDRSGTIGPTFGNSARAICDANMAVQDEVLAAIRPGLVVSEMLDMSNRAAERLGYEIQGGRIGHGQGLDYSEEPFLMEGSDRVLEPGNVFVLHTCLGVPGTNILVNPIADLCHVTEDGVEVLNGFQRDYFHA
ncbi:MAG: M24 family metallopeptidase [Chloroflexi bacterium]|nr:M24 family metallopeptidase [Chloroflexota bacterium]MCY3938819.1 M24 family metallopeptidase [Chloroflexota bacterium]